MTRPVTELEPCDLVLVKSPGAAFALGRCASGNTYDHVAVVVGGESINIDKPSARRRPIASVRIGAVTYRHVNIEAGLRVGEIIALEWEDSACCTNTDHNHHFRSRRQAHR